MRVQREKELLLCAETARGQCTLLYFTAKRHKSLQNALSIKTGGEKYRRRFRARSSFLKKQRHVLKGQNFLDKVTEIHNDLSSQFDITHTRIAAFTVSFLKGSAT